MKGYGRYFGGKMVWLLITFVFALLLNFILPRLMPGDPVAVITQRVTQGMQSQSGIQAVYEEYRRSLSEGNSEPQSKQRKAQKGAKK